jgi:hypothetical protein
MGPREAPSSKVQYLLNQVRDNDNITLLEKKQVRDFILNFADIFAMQVHDLEACSLEKQTTSSLRKSLKNC